MITCNILYCIAIHERNEAVSVKNKNHCTPWLSDSSIIVPKAKDCLHEIIDCSLPIASPCPVPISFPILKYEDSKVVCNNICGNFLLRGGTTFLKAWEEEISKDVTISITVFNSAHSSSSVEVRVVRGQGNPVVFTVPPGSSLSRTIEGSHSVTIRRISEEQADGKFCLDVCFVK